MSRRTLPKFVLIALLIGGAALRLYFAERIVCYVEDYGTAALMSKHIAEGREFPLYFYGHVYISAIGAYMGALFFAIFGPSLTSLSAAMLPFSTLWIFSTFLLFRRLVSEWAGVIAAAVVALPPLYLVEYSAVPLIGYPTTLAFGTLILYLGVRLNDRDLTPATEWLCLLGLGALAGLAIWTHPLCFPYLVIGFGLLMVHTARSRFARPLLVKLGIALVLFVVTLMPVIVTAHTHGLTSMFWHWPSKLKFVPGNSWALLTWYVPNQLIAGDRMPAAANWLAGIAFAFLGASFITGFVVALLKRSSAPVRAGLVPISFVIVFILVFLPNSLVHILSYRYFTPFYLGVTAAFAFPLVYRCAWLNAATAILAVGIVAYNVTDTIRDVNGAHGRGAAQLNAAFLDLARRVEAIGLRHVAVDGGPAQALTFAARERVIFCASHNGSYYPYMARVDNDDNAGFLQADWERPCFEGALDALNISTYYLLQAPPIGFTLFYDIVLPTDTLRSVQPVAASLIGPSGTRVNADALFDRNDETIVGDRFDAESALVIDFGKSLWLSAARFVAPHTRDYPAGYSLLGSVNGRDWTEIQHVEDREPLACIYGNRLFYRNRYAAMECRFSPTELQWLKVEGFRTAALHHKIRRYPYRVWRFNEAFFFSPAGDSGRPDKEEATEIARELERHGVELAMADEWLSRKIEMMPRPRPDVLPRYEYRFPASRVPRLLSIRPGVAVVVETAHADEAGAILGEATLGDVALARHDFPHYTAYIITEAPTDYESFPGLRWNGFTLVRTARIATADWYHRHGEQLERADHSKEAMSYFQRAFETFPGIRANLERLAPHDERARAMLAALTPEVEAPIGFPHGASLVGYTLTPSPLVPGERATLRLVWALEGVVKHAFKQVFIHFIADGQRLFQADHNAVFPVAPGSTVPHALVLDEHEFLVPNDVPADVVTIHLGATALSDRTLRLRPRTKLRTHHRAVEIGTAEIYR